MIAVSMVWKVVIVVVMMSEAIVVSVTRDLCWKEKIERMADVGDSHHRAFRNCRVATEAC